MFSDAQTGRNAIVLFSWSYKKKGTHPDTVITPGQLGKLLKPRSGDYLGHRKATFRDKLLLVDSHIQRTQMASTSISTPLQIPCIQLTLAYSIYPE